MSKHKTERRVPALRDMGALRAIARAGGLHSIRVDGDAVFALRDGSGDTVPEKTIRRLLAARALIVDYPRTFGGEALYRIRRPEDGHG